MSSSTTHIVVDSVPSQQSSTSRTSRSSSPNSARSSGRPRSNSASLQKEVEAERAEALSHVVEQEAQRFDAVDQLHHNLEETTNDAMAMFARSTPKQVEVPVTDDSETQVQQPKIVNEETFVIKPTSSHSAPHHMPEHLDIPSKSPRTHATLIDTLTNYDPEHHSHHAEILPSKPYTSADVDKLAEKDAQIAALSMALIKARAAHREAVNQNSLLADPKAASTATSAGADDSSALTSADDRSSALLTVVPTSKDDQSLRSYLRKLPTKRESLMIQRTSSNTAPPTFEQKFVTLTYDAIYLRDQADDQGAKVADLSQYWLIERTEDRAASGTITNYAASHARLANAPAAPVSPMAGHSIFRKEGDAYIIRLVPIVRDPSAPHLIVEPEASQMLELTGLTERALDSPDTLAEWVDAINLRISLLNLLKAEDHSQVLAHGGKQILTFLCSVDSSSLVVENRFLNALKVLPHFKEALVHRRNYSITFRNVGLDDNGVRVLSEILMMNHSIKALDLSWNAITDAGMSYLAPVFDLNKRALNDSVNLSYNMIQSEGLREFAQAIAGHPLRKVVLKGNKFGDDALMQFFTAITQSSDSDNSSVRRFELLDFSDNALTNASIGPLGSLLAQLEIESLNLSHNTFTDAGLAALLVRLKQGEVRSLSTLRSIDFSHNRLTSGSVPHLLNMFKSTRNVRLDISGNQFTSHALKSLFDSDVSLQVDSLAIRAVQSTSARAGDTELTHSQSFEKRVESAGSNVTEKVASARLAAGSLFGRLMGRKGSRADSSPSPTSSDEPIERRGSFNGRGAETSADKSSTDKSINSPESKPKTPEPI